VATPHADTRAGTGYAKVPYDRWLVGATGFEIFAASVLDWIRWYQVMRRALGQMPA